MERRRFMKRRLFGVGSPEMSFDGASEASFELVGSESDVEIGVDRQLLFCDSSI
jgi:hypothetical protein